MKICLRLLMNAKAYWKYLAFSMAAMIGLTVSQLYAPWVVRDLTNLALANDPDIAEKSLWMGISLFVIYVIQAGCQFFRQYLTHYAAWHFVADMRVRIYDKLQQLSLKYYNDKQTGQLMSRIINDTAEIEVLVAHAAPDLIVNVLIFASVAVMLFIINAKLAAVSLISIPFLVLMSLFYSKKVLPKFRKRQKVVGLLNGTLQDNLTGMKEIQAFNQQKTEKKRVSSLAVEHAEMTLHALKFGAVYHPFVQFFSSMGTVFVIAFGGALAANREIPIADVIAFIMYLGIFYQPITTMARVNEDIQTAIAGSERVYEVLDEDSDVKEKATADTLKNVTGRIDFDNVSFQYNDTGAVLKDINLEILPGQMIALVGPTGVGKTTLISLLNRFYDPTDGAILIDGTDIRDVTLRSLHDSISIVLQDVFLFNGTVAENIAYGCKGATAEQIIEASKIARAHEFIERLENGYDTEIGERGARLSGGQKQRISIARAVLRDKPILILDEATAAVDVETEKLIQEAMDIVMKNRTTILIAHRLSTIKKADKIIVLNDGTIEESGTHETLMQHGGLYAKLAKIQYALND
ncbi:MAG: ABC transporter ATP-binding protein/permease [Clostridiales bacterium]|jgi:ATP-binding cassette subfamily B protein|nr:ABC transporter ATP-binding protein/permease [Clostridiales bacterium]